VRYIILYSDIVKSIFIERYIITMPNRAAANTGRIINRTSASGGSKGGNDKQGLVRFSNWSMINNGFMLARIGAPQCCKMQMSSGSSISSTPMPIES